MFSDFLYQTISQNLDTDNLDTFATRGGTGAIETPSPAIVQTAVDRIGNAQPITDRSTESLLTQFLFARTLKDLLQDPHSDLSRALAGKNDLRKTLNNVYVEIISGLTGKRVATMPGPFVVPDLQVIVGSRVTKLGEGTYGKVYSTTGGFAVKVITNEELDAESIRETAILHYLDHPNVVNLTAMQLDPPAFAMPLAAGTLEGISLQSMSDRQWYFYQLFRGLAYCHSKYVWHRDIKPANVLVFDNPSISGGPPKIAKLADFGLSIPYARVTRGQNLSVASLWWRAPEILLGDTNYSQSIDVWSVGVMLLEAATGETLHGVSEIDQLFRIFKLLGTPDEGVWPGVTKLPDWKTTFPIYSQKLSEVLVNIDAQEADLIKKVLSWPHKRISALDALKLPYFSSVRGKLDVQIPARPIVIETCGQMMLREQISVVEHDWLGSQRKVLYEWLYDVWQLYRLNSRTLFYTFTLFDLLANSDKIARKEIQKYGLAALAISNYIYSLILFETGDYVYLADYSFTNKEFEDAIESLLSKTDFNIIKPTCDDFVWKYLEGESYGIRDYTHIMLYAYILTLDYSYASTFTPAQMAQISIEAVLKAGTSQLTRLPTCLKGTTALLDQSIWNYLVTLINTSKQIKQQFSQLHIAPPTLEAAESMPSPILNEVEILESQASPPPTLGATESPILEEGEILESPTPTASTSE